MGAAVGLSSGAAQADGFVSPGLLATWTFGERGGFGLGTEVSWMSYSGRYNPGGFYAAYGAFLQAEALFGEGRSFRGAIGGQAAPGIAPMAGAELGMVLQRDSVWRGGVHGGVYGSAGIVSLAWRGTFTGPGEGGVQHALALTLKAPIMYGCPPPLCIEGRPLRPEDGGDFLFPDVVAGPLMEPSRRSDFDASDAEEVSRWLSAGRAEYASVPAFLELAADLHGARAPEVLVDGALAAAADEVRHAALCFTIASHHAGRTLRPRWMPQWSRPSRACASRPEELARLAVESLEDGVVGEGEAARRALRRADAARDARIAHVHRLIARDEHRHARLGADIVTWAEAEGGRGVRQALATVPAARARG